MSDSEKNIRTLIVSFVIAVMVMVPLRMVEYGQTGEARVLGVKEEKACLTPLEADRMRVELLTKVRDQAMTPAELDEVRVEIDKIKELVCR